MNSEINNFKERSDFWAHIVFNNSFDANWINEAVANMLDDFNLFKEKDVLEIGPGSGRQMEFFRPHCKSYVIADISEKIFEKLPDDLETIFMKDYDVDAGKKFDIVHFWFVIHHVLKKEIDGFIGFILRHLKEDGIILFNAPTKDYSKRFEENGMKTTLWEEEEIISKFGWYGYGMASSPIHVNLEKVYLFKKIEW